MKKKLKTNDSSPIKPSALFDTMSSAKNTAVKKKLAASNLFCCSSLLKDLLYCELFFQFKTCNYFYKHCDRLAQSDVMFV